MGNFWTGYSRERLEDIQDRVLELVEQGHEQLGQRVKFERVHTALEGTLPHGKGKGTTLHTIECIKCNENGKPATPDKPPIVIVHGYMAGSLMFANNLANLAFRTERRVIALDWLGCGASSRPKFLCKDGKETVSFFLDSFEQWRKIRGLEHFDLVAHSLGGYLSVHYMLREGQRHVDHLVLASPAGFPTPPDLQPKDLPFRFRMLFYLWGAGYNPNHIIRGTGPFGKSFVTKFVDRRFGTRTLGLKGLLEEEHGNLMIDYIHHISAAPGSGEHALAHLLLPGAFPKEEPLVTKLPKVEGKKVLIVFGDQDWMARDIQAARQAASRMRDTQVITIPGTHHVYLFSDEFDHRVINFFDKSDPLVESTVQLVM